MVGKFKKKQKKTFFQFVKHGFIISRNKFKMSSCEHCNYDYTQEKGMLFDEAGPNRIYIIAYKKWQLQPCSKCDKTYIQYLDNMTKWAEYYWFVD